MRKLGRMMLWLWVIMLLLPASAYAAPMDDLMGYWQNAYTNSNLVFQIYEAKEQNGRLGLYKEEVLAKAPPDECFDGLGPPYPTPTGSPLNCAGGQTLKTNQAYVWGLAKAGGKLWFGTIANTHCLVIGALGLTTPVQTPSFVCEFGQGKYSQPFPVGYGLPAAVGDWRPPKLYSYDLLTNTLTDITASAGPLVNSTTGIRSAGALGNVVFLAGPKLGTGVNKGVNIFAYNAATGARIGATTLAQYSDIRQWLVVNGVLYTAVENSDGSGGSVLKWIGNEASPFQFEVVGNLNGLGAYLALHESRIFVTTWPVLGSGNTMALYMSPIIVPGGNLSNADAGNWIKVWKAEDYEPDALTAQTYGGGALFSHKGFLYWGTMHVPLAAVVVALRVPLDLDYNGNGLLDEDELLATFLGTHRPIMIFRGKRFGTTAQTMEVMYGQRYLPVYDPALKTYTIASDLAHQNKMLKPLPKKGPAGFGNFFNSYTWVMSVYDNRLFIGTFDWSYLYDEMAATFLEGQPLPPINTQPGTDLFRIDSALGTAKPESILGVGNITNYGVRTILTDPETNSLFLGMANPMNLHQNGGWELIKLWKP